MRPRLASARLRLEPVTEAHLPLLIELDSDPEVMRVPGIVRVVASTMAVNVPSRRVLEKLGLHHTDTEFREWDDPIPGWEQGEVAYEVRRSTGSGPVAGA